ncbi:MAG: hypothetical protein GWN58_27540 [Anaerolineae bacterium]|nr:hypothetical protein [Anaerolineae bacterium]
MNKKTTGALIALLILLVVLLDHPIKRSLAGDHNPIIQLYLLATGLLIAVGAS